MSCLPVFGEMIFHTKIELGLLNHAWLYLSGSFLFAASWRHIQVGIAMESMTLQN